MAVVMSDNRPSRRVMNVPSSPALSLTLAGVFQNAVDMGADAPVRREDSCSDNSEPAGSRSAEDLGVEPDDEDEDEDKGLGNRKKRKNRHTSEQIREMEKVFKESPHPDEKQRQKLSENLGLHSKQIKFWFQNRRTQIKVSLERQEMEKLREENQALKEMINKSSCLKCCSSANSIAISMDSMFTSSDQKQQQLVTEIVRLKAEVEGLKTALEQYAPAGTSRSRLGESEDAIEGRRNLEKSKRIFGLEKARVMEIAKKAIEEVVKMADSGEPLWIRSFETGRELLNYDEYMKQFAGEYEQQPKGEIEASRESGVVFVDLHRLVQSFMDVVQWKEMFPSIISKASTIEVVCNGDGSTRNGAVQLMFAELQMLTPVFPPREVYFIRTCKRLSPEKWVVADVSINNVGDSIDSSPSFCRKRPSGCIIEDTSNGHCKVIVLEHWECQKTKLRTMYRTIVNSGLIFGARHWMATMQTHCEWQVFYMATNVPMKDSTGITTLGGRKSVLRLAQRMTSSVYQAMGASSSHTWTKVQSKIGENIRVASRKNLNDPREPLGLILCAVASVWLPISPKLLFEFLINGSRRIEWDVMLSGPVETLAVFAKGQNRGNAVTIQAIKSDESNKWIIQDTLTNDYESTVIYAQIDITSMQSVMVGCDPSTITTLPMGFSILPDGHPPRASVISKSKEERVTEGGSLLTIATQTSQSAEYVNDFVSHMLENIKASLQVEDD
ncbi:homeobox-leucine zipper protein GLABRA 2-like [Cucurbita pepo subsp. pepo]|uniref:homeobox-leucine zipper protein GLABRA 2-like n=1 Tax=Cucurbita pepo subsp. pepo TaxID=3664 RepID=UPI000C9D56CA|nr:homeobox-leucine zipper protein GLABRA 2-like [Cucurbita pepo subsp. pepo]